MRIQDTRELAELANRAALESRRPGAPTLAEDSDTETVAAWLQWCDPNGSHTAELALADDLDPYDCERAWDTLADMLCDAA